MTEHEMLVELLKNFYIDKSGLYYSWREDVPLRGKLNRELINFTEENSIRSF